MYSHETIINYLHKMGTKTREYLENPVDLAICVTYGNRKIGRVLNVSIPPKFTCRHNCDQCLLDCYDIKANIQYGNVLNARARNYAILLKDREKYFNMIEQKLSPRRKRKYFRWHVGGDIIDLDYFVHMCDIAKRHSDWVFWTYTKQYDIVNAYIAKYGAIPSNLSVMFSVWDGVPCVNPYGLQTFSVYEHGDKVPTDAWQCTGNCEICIECKAGCPYGQSAWTYKH